MPITVDQFANLFPSGNLFSDPRLPAGSPSTGSYMPRAAGGTANVGLPNIGAPIGSGAAQPFPTIPNFELPDIAGITAAINQMMQQGFQQSEQNRIPGQAGLENESSSVIQSLLNPGEYFPGTSREAAELSGMRGFAEGGPSSESTWVRMTENERLARMGLGQQFLTAALGRHPIGPQYDPSGLASYMAQLPGQRAQLLTQQQQFAQSQQQARDLAAAQMENAFRIAQLGALRSGGRLTGGGGYPNYGGGTGGGATTAGGTPRPLPGPPTLARPEGGGWSISDNAIPDNWADLTPAQRAQYAGLINANPYFGLPDWQNPYYGEEPPAQAWGAPPGQGGLPPIGMNFDFEDIYA